MPVKLPVEIVYYFEISPIGDRLLYCIPKAVLRTMQKKKELDGGIVKDYPDGLDIKVTSEALEKFKMNYNLQLDLDPHSLSNAFQFLKYKFGKEFPKTGFIKKKFLEDLAQKLNSKLKERKIVLISESENIQRSKTKEKKVLLKKLRKEEKKVISEFKKIENVPFDTQVPLAKQDFLNVKMSDGDKAFDFFSKMQHRTERRK
jgi:hypothetical protein